MTTTKIMTIVLLKTGKTFTEIMNHEMWARIVEDPGIKALNS